MLDLTWKEKQMGRGAREVEWHLEDRKGLRLKWQEASKKSRWEVGQVYYQRGHWMVTVHILLEKQWGELIIFLNSIWMSLLFRFLISWTWYTFWETSLADGRKLCHVTLTKAVIRKTAEQEGGVQLCSRMFELVIQNIFVNGKYCVCNSKLLPLEEKSNIREAYFNKAELARTVLPLL